MNATVSSVVPENQSWESRVSQNFNENSKMAVMFIIKLERMTWRNLKEYKLHCVKQFNSPVSTDKRR